MKKRAFWIIVLCIFGWGVVDAKSISEQEAIAIVEQYLVSPTSCISVHRTPAKRAFLSMAVTPDTHYYVCNIGQDEGYVVVAGDDRALHTILGYSEDGHFNYDSISDTERWWLSEYERQLASLPPTEDGTEWNAPVRYENNAVTPLLKTIWSQSNPYNLYCPKIGLKNCVAGCVAIAWAQIAYYHNHPASAQGSYSYVWEQGGNVTRSGSIDNTYNWTKMLTKYTSTSTDQQKQAVANLVADMGNMFQTNYGTSASSAGTDYSVGMMVATFGYDKGMRNIYRKYYDTEDADAIMRTELDAGRVIFFVGQNSSGGHAFVADGYNQEGMFHFNYGWGSYDSKYYYTSALRQDYNSKQQMTIGIKPAVSGSIMGADVSLLSDLTATSVYKFSYSVSPHFTLHSACSVEYAIAAENTSSHTIVYGTTRTLNASKSGDWYITTSSVFNLLLPATKSLPNGEYILYPVWRVSGTTTWQKMYMPKRYVRQLHMKVTSGGRTMLPNQVESVLYTDTTFELKVGDTLSFIPKTYPISVVPNLLYTSSNSAIATVNSTGMVLAQDSGMVEITAKVKDHPTISDSYWIHVTGQPLPTHIQTPSLVSNEVRIYNISGTYMGNSILMLPPGVYIVYDASGKRKITIGKKL